MGDFQNKVILSRGACLTDLKCEFFPNVLALPDSYLVQVIVDLDGVSASSNPLTRT